MSANPIHGIPPGLAALTAPNIPVDGASGRSRAGTDERPGLNSLLAVTQNTPTMDGSLPDDDGMQAMRGKLRAIHMMAVSTEEKAARMHHLMTLDYLARRADETTSPALTYEQDGRRDAIPSELSSLAPPVDLQNPYNIHPADLEPTFSPLLHTSPSADMEEGGVRDTSVALGCAHYKRNVKVQCFDCHLWFPCRHCHDHSQDLPFPHALNRKKTQYMLCMLCCTPQPAAETCSHCGEYAAWYYCAKCKLWDNDSNKRIYHCDECGICRVGEGLGKDYVHCRRCNVCISISTSAAHPCIERATEGSCPLCLVELFESRTPVVSLPCGHYMHGDCYKDLMGVTYKCPVCSKSAVNMELQWRKLDDEIRMQPMPEDDADLEGLLPHVDAEVETVEHPEINQDARPRRPRSVWIGCNDCVGRCWTPFHWLGLKCQNCDSYNTSQMAPTAFRETEAERVVRQQLQHHRQHDFTGDAVLRDAGIGVEDQPPSDPVDRTLDVPSSPSNLPITESPQASGAQSPGGSGRYFVQDAPPRRRPSYTASSRFSAPNLPTMPNFAQLPDMPRMPRMPQLPNMPAIELPRFSPAGMIDAVSRSLSPMRYYLQGLDLRDEQQQLSSSRRRARAVSRRNKSRGSPSSVRSDPTPTPAAEDGDAGEQTRRQSRVVSEELWGSESEDDLDDDDEDNDDDEDPDDEAGVREDEDDAGAGHGMDLELRGHR